MAIFCLLLEVLMVNVPQARHDQSASIDHRDIIRNLSDDQRRDLRQLSNRAGLVRLSSHTGMIALTGSYIIWGLPLWPLMMLPLGILLIFLFTLLHECIHETPFRSRWINRLVGIVIGFLIFLPPAWFRCFHMAHHRHTQDRDNDPELDAKKPESWMQYGIYLSGIPTWYSQLLKIVRLAMGGPMDGFVPGRAQKGVGQQARLFVVGYAILIALSIFQNSTVIIWAWLVPLIFGQPFLRAYLLAEHGRCPYVSNMLDNTRTTFTSGIVRYLAWNMPYHTEHHSYPVVPFHKLPVLHNIMKKNLRNTEDGFVRFHTDYVSRF